MDIVQLRDSLVQTLENYQRCGLTRIDRVPAESLSPELLAAVERLANHARPEKQQAVEADRGQQTHLLANSLETSTGGSRAAASGGISRTRANRGDVGAAAAGGQAGGQLASGAAAEAGKWMLPVVDDVERQQRFDGLDAEVKACRKCADIVSYRHQTVFGTGPLRPRLCFMGEAPGADEDRQGVPFVGKAGQLLTKIIQAMKIDRKEVYILNALKCRPPQNRTPVPEEIEACRYFVETQLETLQPEFIVCLGAVAVRSILQSSQSIGRLRGRLHSYRGAKVVVTYHPSYLLRNADAKRLVWDDMKMLMGEMGMMP